VIDFELPRKMMQFATITAPIDSFEDLLDKNCDEDHPEETFLI
jgi:hypothetical protein